MVNSIEDIIELHKNYGNIEDAIIKIHIDEKILGLNIFSLKVTPIEATKEDVEIWNDRIAQELKKDKELEKEVREFATVFEFLNKMKVRSGVIRKNECPDFVITRNETSIGIEVTKIYVGYDWMVEKIAAEIKEYRLEKEDIEGYIEYRKAGDKVEFYNENGAITLSPKLFPLMNEEYQVKIKNKLYEKIRKQIDEYEKFDVNIIYADITSPEYFDDITDLDAFSKEVVYYMHHLDANMNFADYRLVIKINSKWIELNLNDGTYKLI